MNGEYTGGDVQELVDAVLEITPCVHVDEAVGEAVMLTCDWDRIRAAAEKLRGRDET